MGNTRKGWSFGGVALGLLFISAILLFFLLAGALAPAFPSSISNGATAGGGFGPFYVGPFNVSGISGGTHVNWNGAALTTLSNGALNFTTTNNAGAFNVEGLAISAPSTPYRITMQLVADNFALGGIYGGQNAFGGAGLFWSDGTKFVLFRIDSASPPKAITVQLATATTVGAGGNQTVGTASWQFPGNSPGLWLRILDDGVNRKTCISNTGLNFIQFDTIARTTWLTATQVGAFIMNASALILNWSQDAGTVCNP